MKKRREGRRARRRMVYGKLQNSYHGLKENKSDLFPARRTSIDRRKRVDKSVPYIGGREGGGGRFRSRGERGKMHVCGFRKATVRSSRRKSFSEKRVQSFQEGQPLSFTIQQKTQIDRREEGGEGTKQVGNGNSDAGTPILIHNGHFRSLNLNRKTTR